jgi:CheY-like chemotaxis protein
LLCTTAARQRALIRASSGTSIKLPSRTTQKSYRILVIEDNLDQVHSLALLLKEMGHAVDYAINGYVALDVARRFKPDVVICDLGLPGMTGFEIITQLRSDPELKDVKAIALTGYPQYEERAEAAGFDFVFAKPLDPKVLYDMFGDTKDGSTR